MKKAIRAQEQKDVKSTGPSEPSSQPLPQYLLDRSGQNDAKALSSAIKNKRNEKAAKFSVPLPKVKGISEEEMFKVVKTGKKTQKKGWKRMITKPTFGESPLQKYHASQKKLCQMIMSRLWCSLQDRLLTDIPSQLGRISLDDRSNTSALSGQWVCDTRKLTSRTQSSK